MTGTDHRPMGRHLLSRAGQGAGGVKHACPDCPTPLAGLAGGLVLPANAACQWCGGSGLVDESTLHRWQLTQGV